MTEQSRHFLKSYRGAKAGGLTLIEVVAGLALLGWLLSAVVLAKARYTRQWAAANRSLQATEAADRLLTQWWLDPMSIPAPATGRIEDAPELDWSTSIIVNDNADRLGAQVIRLEIHDQRGPQGSEPLVAVDLVFPDQKNPPSDSFTQTGVQP